MGLEGARILVVGASTGIGREVAVGAVAAGAQVVMAARRKDKLADAVEQAGGGHALELDVRATDTIPAAVAEAVDVLGEIDIVLSAAGTAEIGLLDTVDAEQWKAVFETNVIGAALLSTAVAPSVSAGGLLAYLSSVTSIEERWGLAPYGVSKAALNRLVDSLRSEYPDLRFTNVILGSALGSEFGSGFDGETLTQAFSEWVVRAQATKRMMAVADVAAVLLDLLATLHRNRIVDIPQLLLEPAGGRLHYPLDDESEARCREVFFGG